MPRQGHLFIVDHLVHGKFIATLANVGQTSNKFCFFVLEKLVQFIETSSIFGQFSDVKTNNISIQIEKAVKTIKNTIRR